MQTNIIPIKKGEEKDINIEINCIYIHEAPILKGEKIGNIIIKNKDEIIESIDIVIKNEIKRKNVISYMIQFLENLPTALDFCT